VHRKRDELVLQSEREGERERERERRAACDRSKMLMGGKQWEQITGVEVEMVLQGWEDT